MKQEVVSIKTDFQYNIVQQAGREHFYVVN